MIEAVLDPERQRKAKEYARIRHRLLVADLAITAVYVLVLLLSGLSAWFKAQCWVCWMTKLIIRKITVMTKLMVNRGILRRTSSLMLLTTSAFSAHAGHIYAKSYI